MTLTGDTLPLLIGLVLFAFAALTLGCALIFGNLGNAEKSRETRDPTTPEECDQISLMKRAQARLIEAETELLMKQTENQDVSKFIADMRRKQNG